MALSVVVCGALVQGGKQWQLRSFCKPFKKLSNVMGELLFWMASLKSMVTSPDAYPLLSLVSMAVYVPCLGSGTQKELLETLDIAESSLRSGSAVALAPELLWGACASI